jgi:hypothetical protein
MTNENDSDKPATNPQGQPPSQLPVTPSAPAESEIRADPNKRPASDKDTAKELAREFRWVEFAQLAVNGVLAIIGIFALYIYHGQLEVMSGQLTEMTKAREQAKVDNANAITAQQGIAQTSLAVSQQNFERSLRDTQQSFRNDQRAWIGRRETKVTQFDKGRPFTVGLEFFNSGKTPAQHITTNMKLKLSRTPISGPTQTEIMQIEKEKFRAHAGIAPQGTVTYTMGIPPVGGTPSSEEVGAVGKLAADFEDIKAKKLIVYTWGELRYDDVSGKHHVTQFCVFLADPIGEVLANCNSFNDLN